MKKIYLLLSVLTCAFNSNAQITLYSNNFTNGSTGWSLDNNEVQDGWTVNSSYNCSPTGTPDRSGGNYLHIYNDLMTDLCALGYYGGGSSITANADMTANINTTGYDTVTLSFWWLCKGTSQSYGSVWYSTNGGTSWLQFTTRSKYISQNTWANETITIHASSYPDILNKTNVRLRFQWKNGGIGANPAFSVDDILVTGNGSNGCTNAVGSSVAIRPSICSGQIDSIGLTSYTGNIQWQQSPNGTTGWVNVTGGIGDTTAFYTTPALTATTYYRAMVSQASCTDKYSSVTTVTVNPSVTPSVSISVSPSSAACAGDTLFFTPTVSNGGSVTTYRWIVNSLDVSTDPTYFSNTLGNNSTVTCAITSNVACASTSQATSNTLTTQTLASVTPTINIQANSTSVCKGELVSFTATVNNPGTTPVYEWKVNGSSEGNDPTFAFNAIYDSAVVTCSLTSNAQCASPKTITSAPVTIRNQTAPDTTITITGATTFCESDSVELTAAAGLTYLWSTGATTRSITAKETDTYIVTVSNTFCSAPSRGIGVTVNTWPEPTITLSSDTFTSSAANSYQWYFNDTLIPGSTNQWCKVGHSGYYSVEVTGSNGCSSKSEQTYYLITGIGSITDNTVIVYPNPLVTGNWQLLVDDKLVGSSMEISDANGRIAYQSKLSSMRSELGSDIMPGIYFLTIRSETGTVVRKLVKL